MMKKLRKITDFATVPKSAELTSYQKYRSQILRAHFEHLSEDCVKNQRPYL